MLEKTLERPLDCKEIQPVNPKGNQSWIFIGRTDAKAEAPILWPPAVKNWPIGKDPDAGKDWRQEEKGTTEDEMVRWHHRLNGHTFEQTPGVGEGQGSLVCYSPRCRKESDMTEWLNWTDVLGKSWSQSLNMWCVGGGVILEGLDLSYQWLQLLGGWGGGRNPNSGKNDGLPVEEGPEDRGGAETYICGCRFIGAHRETPQQGVWKWWKSPGWIWGRFL